MVHFDSVIRMQLFQPNCQVAIYTTGGNGVIHLNSEQHLTMELY